MVLRSYSATSATAMCTPCGWPTLKGNRRHRASSPPPVIPSEAGEESAVSGSEKKLRFLFRFARSEWTILGDDGDLNVQSTFVAVTSTCIRLLLLTSSTLVTI